MNIVTVAINAVEQDGSNLNSGSLVFTASDIAWVQAGNFTAHITPVTISSNGGQSTGGTVELLAMDNPGVSTNWKWIMSGVFEGFVIPRRYLTVNFAAGANQNLADLLQASTLVGS